MIFSRVTIASAIGCGLMMLALVVSYRMDMRRDGITFTEHFHSGIFDGGLWFYSDQLPYHGSIIQLGDQPPILQKSGFDCPGVYYRYFRFPTNTIWSVMISLWYPVVALAILPVIWMFHRRRHNLKNEEVA
jgi:hypothetical protein